MQKGAGTAFGISTLLAIRSADNSDKLTPPIWKCDGQGQVA